MQLRTHHLHLVLATLTLITGSLLHAADYCISTAGDDRQNGASAERAWKTIARANRHALGPGDRLLFLGGDMFDGNLVLKVAGAPSADNPVTVGSFGKGKATILAGDGTAIQIENSGGIVVRDLIVTGKDRRTNKGSGISILNT